MQHMKEFRDQKQTVQTHIPSKYSVEMASRSEVVSIISCFYKHVIICDPLNTIGSIRCLIV